MKTILIVVCVYVVLRILFKLSLFIDEYCLNRKQKDQQKNYRINKEKKAVLNLAVFQKYNLDSFMPEYNKERFLSGEEKTARICYEGFLLILNQKRPEKIMLHSYPDFGPFGESQEMLFEVENVLISTPWDPVRLSQDIKREIKEINGSDFGEGRSFSNPCGCFYQILW